MTVIIKLRAALAHADGQLELWRERELSASPGTMRRAKASRNMDYWAEERRRLRLLIEETEKQT